MDNKLELSLCLKDKMLFLNGRRILPVGLDVVCISQLLELRSRYLRACEEFLLHKEPEICPLSRHAHHSGKHVLVVQIPVHGSERHLELVTRQFTVNINLTCLGCLLRGASFPFWMSLKG